MVKINSSPTRADQLLSYNKAVESRSEKLIKQRDQGEGIPVVTNRMAKSVSAERREIMELQIDAGELREQGSSGFYSKGNSDEESVKMIHTKAGVVAHNGKPIYKTSASTGAMSSGGADWRGATGTVQQMPEQYSPLWLNSNLSLPRDRVTINAWCRAYFALNPVVHNAITLHSTYPIAKLNIKSKNRKVEKLCNEMMEEVDLMNICVQLAQEYWTVGEAFAYAELDENKGSWSRIMILNPDYVNIQRNVIAAEPIISLRPDENLRRVVTSNQQADIQQRKQLDPAIIEHVRRNENIPLNNFYVSHIARRIAPFETRGTGLPVSCFRALMLWDRLRESKYYQAESLINPLTLVKIGNQDFRPTPVDLENFRQVFECYDNDTEVLTNKGFRRFSDVIWNKPIIDKNTGEAIYESGMNAGYSVACFNPETEMIEYHKPTNTSVYDYSGDMIKFSGKSLDVKVTPNHDMWINKQYHDRWEKIKAEKLPYKAVYRTRAIANFAGNKPEFINVLGNKVPIELYLKFIGYLISEGSIELRDYSYGGIAELCLTQSVKSDCIDDMRQVANDFAAAVGLKVWERTLTPSGDIYKTQPPDVTHFHIRNKKLVLFFKNEFSTNGLCDSKNKQIPAHILNLDPSLLKIMLDKLVLGDGSTIKNKESISFKYYTSSKILADNIQEIIFKCGFSSNISTRNRLKKYKGKRAGQEYLSTEYTIGWSNHITGSYPSIYGAVSREYYNGKVWCLTVPTGLFVTRRNGKITIQGNSAASNKDFKIFTHDAVSVEPVGFGQGIYDTSGDVTQLIKEVYTGLMVPSVIMDGSDTTYATGSVSLDVLRQRYMQFRQYITSWLRKRIFAPICQLNDCYERIEGEKILIVPDIDWNHMSLFDMDSYINNMVNLSQGEGTQKRVSQQTLYRSLGLEYEEEQRRIRFEDIQDAIRTKEIAALQQHSLHELKSLSPGDEIEEVADQPVPGESPYETPSPSDGEGMGGGSSGPSLPSVMPGSPPPAPIGKGPSGGGKPPSTPSLF